MLYNTCYVINITQIMVSYKTHNMLCYITHNILRYKTHVMLYNR